MILAAGTYENSGGLRTLTDSYRRTMEELGWECHWLLFGTGAPPPEEPGCTFVQLRDSWSFYADECAVDPLVRYKVEELAERLNPEFVFRPLQFTYEPYLNSLKFPSLKTVHLVTRALIESAELRPYADDPKVKGSLSADRVRALHEYAYLRSAEILLVNSHTSLKDLERHYRLDAEVAVSPPGAEDLFFSVPEPDLERKVLFFGRLNHQKGVPALLQSVPGDWELTCIGSGKWKSQDFARFGIRHLEWTSQSEIRSALHPISYCVFPSHYEPWGLSLNEALAAGRICIAQCGAGGHEEQIRHGHNGFLIDFERGTYWESLEWIHSLGRAKLLEISAKARLTARRWSNHVKDFETLVSAWRARGSFRKHAAGGNADAGQHVPLEFNTL